MIEEYSGLEQRLVVLHRVVNGHTP
jgi:hypothetical protein